MTFAVLHPEAQKELDEAADYYEEKREGLGKDFVDEVEKGLQFVEKHPKASGFYRKTKYRKKVLRRFPFLIIYREKDEFVWVVAIAHARRKPGYWLDRDQNGGQ